MTKDIMAGLEGRPDPVEEPSPRIPPADRPRPANPSPVPGTLITQPKRSAGRPPGKLAIETRFRHHQAAKMMAEGMGPTEIAAAIGVSNARIHQLKADPAMKELVAFYAGKLGETWDAMHKRLATLGGMAVDELMDKLEADPDSFTKKDLLDIANMALERSGMAPAPKGSASVQVGAVGINIQIAFKSPEPAESPPPMIDITPDDPS